MHDHQAELTTSLASLRLRGHTPRCALSSARSACTERHDRRHLGHEPRALLGCRESASPNRRCEDLSTTAKAKHGSGTVQYRAKQVRVDIASGLARVNADVGPLRLPIFVRGSGKARIRAVGPVKIAM